MPRIMRSRVSHGRDVTRSGPRARVVRCSRGRYDVRVNKTLAAFLSAAAMAAHARYEEVVPGDAPSVPDEASLLPYTLIALALWAVAVWGGGWRRRAVPLVLAVAAFGAAVAWGAAGSGAFVLLACAGLMVYGMTRRR